MSNINPPCNLPRGTRALHPDAVHARGAEEARLHSARPPYVHPPSSADNRRPAMSEMRLYKVWNCTLSWELGIRILSFILKPETAEILCAVNAEFFNIVHDCNAWAGLVVHVEHLEAPTPLLSRMLPAWRLLDRLYLSSFQARRLGGTCPCPIAWTWSFSGPAELIGQGGDNSRYVFRSIDAFPPGVRLEFDAFLNCMPLAFDIGWSTDAGWMRLLNHAYAETPQWSGAFYVAAFRVVIGALITPPGADRATWINGEATTEDLAVRLSIPHQRRFFHTRTLEIGLDWGHESMNLYVYGHRYYSGPSSVPGLRYPLPFRHPVLILGPGLDRDDIMLEPTPVTR